MHAVFEFESSRTSFFSSARAGYLKTLKHNQSIKLLFINLLSFNMMGDTFLLGYMTLL